MSLGVNSKVSPPSNKYYFLAFSIATLAMVLQQISQYKSADRCWLRMDRAEQSNLGSTVKKELVMALECIQSMGYRSPDPQAEINNQAQQSNLSKLKPDELVKLEIHTSIQKINQHIKQDFKNRFMLNLLYIPTLMAVLAFSLKFLFKVEASQEDILSAQKVLRECGMTDDLGYYSGIPAGKEELTSLKRLYDYLLKNSTKERTDSFKEMVISLEDLSPSSIVSAVLYLESKNWVWDEDFTVFKPYMPVVKDDITRCQASLGMIAIMSTPDETNLIKQQFIDWVDSL